MMNKLKYALFAAPAAISLLTLQVYMPSYLAEQQTLSLSVIGLVFLLARLVDTVSDPAIGLLSDRTRSRFGPRKPWIILGTPVFLAVFYLLLNAGQGSAAGLFILLSLWYITGTALMVPYYALGAEIEPGYHANTGFAGARALFGLVGTMAALIAPVIFLSDPDTKAMIDLSYMMAVGGFVVGCAALMRIPQRGIESPAMPVRSALEIFKRGSNFNHLMGSQLLNGIGNALPATLFILFATHVLKRADLVGPLLLLYFLSAAVAVPIWGRISRSFSKQACWRAAMAVAALVFMGTFFVTPDRLWLFGAITFITGLMAGADLSLPASMLADVANQDKAESGKARSALYFAVWGTTGKLTQALAIGIAFPLLDFSALVQSAAVPDQPINTSALILIYAIIPSLLKGVAVWLMRDYDLPETKQEYP